MAPNAETLSDLKKRMMRVEGQARKIQIDQTRLTSQQIDQQLKAMEGVLRQARADLLKGEVEHCLANREANAEELIKRILRFAH